MTANTLQLQKKKSRTRIWALAFSISSRILSLFPCSWVRLCASPNSWDEYFFCFVQPHLLEFKSEIYLYYLRLRNTAGCLMTIKNCGSTC